MHIYEHFLVYMGIVINDDQIMKVDNNLRQAIYHCIAISYQKS